MWFGGVGECVVPQISANGGRWNRDCPRLLCFRQNTSAFEIMHNHIYNKPAQFIYGSFCNSSIMTPILNCKIVQIWFNNYGGSMEGMPQSGLEILLEQHCRRGARVVLLSQMFLSTSWQCKMYELPVGNGDLSWMDTHKSINVHVYKKIR